MTERTSFPAVTVPMVDAMIARAQRRWAAGEPSKWAIARADDDVIVGTCGYNEWSQAHGWAELAYDLARAQWGSGLAREAVRAVLRWAYDEGEVRRVQAYVRVDNVRSARLLERIGFVREGCLRGYRVCRGEPWDYVLYAMLRDEWAAVRG